jgi:hypothetical protein
VAETPEDTLRAAVHAAYLDVAKGKLDRGLKAAEHVATAAAAVGTVYTAILAVVYSAATETAQPLPPRAIAPAILLGAALFLSVVSIAYVRSSGRQFNLLPEAATWQEQQVRLTVFMQWMERGARAGSWAIRSAVVFLGGAVVLMPLPFVDLSDTTVKRLIGLVVGIAVVNLVADFLRSRREGEPPDTQVPPAEAEV